MRLVARIAVAALLAGLPLTLAAWPQSPSLFDLAPWSGDCDSIESVPLRQHVNYDTDIQPIWSQRCANCHVDWGEFPEADLDLNPPNSWYFLVDQASSNPNATQIRVVPGRPRQSLLFTKLNCAIQDIGLRMPRARPELPLDEQALIHDWILAGAPEHGDDTIFRGGFQPRG